MELHWVANCVGHGDTVLEGTCEFEANISALTGLGSRIHDEFTCSNSEST
jgi:hypothetical protein